MSARPRTRAARLNSAAFPPGKVDSSHASSIT